MLVILLVWILAAVLLGLVSVMADFCIDPTNNILNTVTISDNTTLYYVSLLILQSSWRSSNVIRAITRSAIPLPGTLWSDSFSHISEVVSLTQSVIQLQNNITQAENELQYYMTHYGGCTNCLELTGMLATLSSNLTKTLHDVDALVYQFNCSVVNGK
jgi:hypothetical protein